MAIAFFSVPTPQPQPQLFLHKPKRACPAPTYPCSPNTKIIVPLCSPSSSSSSSSSTSVIPPSSDELAAPDQSESAAKQSVFGSGGCKACGREEMEKGCNGEGRIQGGIATVPGFGWWPIKAYRPCPGFVASGGRYRRQGQSMDEVASGRGRTPSLATPTADSDPSNKKEGPEKYKR